MYTETYKVITPLLVGMCHVGNVAQKSGEIVVEKGLVSEVMTMERNVSGKRALIT